MRKIAAMVVSALLVGGAVLLVVALSTSHASHPRISPAAAAGITTVPAVTHPQPNLTVAPADVTTLTAAQVSSMQTLGKQPAIATFVANPTIQYVYFSMDGEAAVLSYMYHWDGTGMGCPPAHTPLKSCSVSVVLDAATGGGEGMFSTGGG